MSAPFSQSAHTGASDSFPSFLETDPYPSASREGRRDSDESGTTDAMSRTGTMTGVSVSSTTGPVGEPGLPPSRIASTTGTSTSAARRSVPSPTVSRRNIAAITPRPGSEHSKIVENAPAAATHVPSLTAQGFARPMSSQKLQSQRAVRTSTQVQGLGGVGEDDEDNDGLRRRYSNASINTLRDRMPPTRDGDIPPLPSSRGTDAHIIDGMASGSVVSDHSAAPLNTSQQRQPLQLDVTNSRATTPQTRAKSPPQPLRASWTLGSRRASRQDSTIPAANGGHEKLHSSPTSPNEKRSPNTVAQRPNRNKARNYEFFAGNLIFFVEGRCLNTRAKPLNVVTGVIICLPAALSFVFSAPYLWHTVSPAIPIVFGYIFFVTFSSFLHAAFSDPGILPRNVHPHPPNPAEEDPWTLGPPTTEWVMIRTYPSKRIPIVPDPEDPDAPPGAANAMEVPTKYCKSCNIWRPPRAHHCRTCDACIETQDHHCVWLNNCVGRRNYRYFFTFVGFGTLMAMMLLAISLTHVILYGQRTGVGFGASLSGRLQERMAFAMFIYAVVALPYPGSLWIYHMFLISRGETTREYLNTHKFLPKDRHRPFSQSSWLLNLITVLMRPRTPSYMAFKSRHELGDVRYGHMETKKERRKNLKHRYSASRDAAEKHEMAAMPSSTSPTKQQPSPVDGGHRLNRPFNNTPR